MRIVVIARTRNEQKNIAKFCACYSFADRILVSDGGSEDNTKMIAECFPNVRVRNFEERVFKDDSKLWRNPHGRHINNMIDWATEEGADWIIFDDVDCFPTLHAQKQMRDILETTDRSCVFINRIYTYHKFAWFKDITIPDKKKGTWATSTGLYAWKPGVVRASEIDPWVHDMQIVSDIPTLHLSPPIAALHDFYPEDGSRQEKVQFYRNTGEQPECSDPLDVYKDLQPLEDWMVCE